MKFSVIGDSVEALPLLEAVGKSATHQIGVCSVRGDLAAEMSQRGLVSKIVDSAEELVVDAATEVVVVAEHDVEQSTFLCRQASQAGRHVIAICPDAVSTAYSFEIHLLLDESEHGVLPLTGRWHVETASGQPEVITDVRQLNLNLPIPANEERFSALQLQAVDALSGCLGKFTQVTGLDVPGADGKLLSRSITLGASESSEDRVAPAVIVLTGEESNVAPQINVTSTNGETASIAVPLPAVTGGDAVAMPESALNQICSELADQSSCQRRMEEFSNTLELMEGLAKSLRRRRTVDVYLDSVTERSAFKTQMTAIGCGVMSYVTFGLVALSIAQGLGMPAGLLKLGIGLWIAPVVLFLFAQLLLPLARDRTSVEEKK